MLIRRNETTQVREAALEKPGSVAIALLTAAFVALSVAVPYVVHIFGGPAAGRTFLPMHFFVLLSGLLLGWQSGLAAGILSPLISFSLTGMPPAPMLLPLTLEIAVYGFTAGLLRRYVSGRLWLALIGALVAGRIVVVGMVYLLKIAPPFLYLSNILSAGLPGIAIQVVFLPVLVKLFGRRASGVG